MKALLLGATGLVGKETLAQLRKDDRFDKVLVLARKDGTSDGLVEWRKVDFDSDQSYAPLASDGIDVVFCCLGSTMKQAGSKAAFRRIDVDYPLRVAEALRARASEVRFALVSALGANEESASFYLRSKGQLERALGSIGFLSLEIFQPSFLLGARGQDRGLEDTMARLMRPLSVLLRGPLSKYHAIAGKTVASALIGSVTRPAKAPISVHLYAEMLNM